ncbi:MAG: hypothetical protein ABI455_06710 [Candidatus Dormiibacterota bacterium]
MDTAHPICAGHEPVDPTVANLDALKQRAQHGVPHRDVTLLPLLSERDEFGWSGQRCSL